MRRKDQGKFLAGVTTGLAEYFNTGVIHVRLSFVILALAFGSGVVLYLALWAIIPMSDEPPPVAVARPHIPPQVLLGSALVITGSIIIVAVLTKAVWIIVGATLIIVGVAVLISILTGRKK